jgi:hypothetical protein
MADATLDRKTEFVPSAINLPQPGGYGVAAADVIQNGVMQTLDSSDRPKNPGSTSERVIGVAAERYDNSAGANDAIKANFRRGPHKFALHATNPPVAGDVGKMGYASDNQTISKDAGDGSLAGEILLVESDGVWVNIGYAPLALTASVTALTDNSGGAAADGTIGIVTAPTAIAATLTDSTGLSGTHDDTLAATTVPAALTGGESPTEAEHNAVLTLLGVMTQNASDTAQKVIEVVAAEAQDRTAIVALTDAVAELATKVNAIINALK